MLINSNNQDSASTLLGLAAILITVLIALLIKGVKKHFQIEELRYRTNCELCETKLNTVSESSKGVCKNCEKEMGE